MPSPKRPHPSAKFREEQKADLRMALAVPLDLNATRAQILITLLRVRTLELRDTWLKKLKQSEPIDPKQCPFGDTDVPVTAAMILSELPSILHDVETVSIWRELHDPLEALAVVAERHGIDSTPLRELRGARYERELDQLERLCERLEVCEKMDKGRTKPQKQPPLPSGMPVGDAAVAASAEQVPNHTQLYWNAEVARLRDSMLTRVMEAMKQWGARPKGPLSAADAADLADVYLDAIDMLRVAFDYLEPERQTQWIATWHAWSLALTGHIERACAQFGVDAVPISTFAQDPQKSTLVAGVAAVRALMNKAQAQTPPPPDENLTSSEDCVVQALREEGRRLSGPDLLKKAFGKANPNGKAILASLVKRKVITNRRDLKPPGYGLPDWP